MWWSTYWSNISCKTCTILLKTVFSEESNYSVCLICAKLKDLNKPHHAKNATLATRK